MRVCCKSFAGGGVVWGAEGEIDVNGAGDGDDDARGFGICCSSHLLR